LGAVFKVVGADAKGRLYRDNSLTAVGRTGEIIKPLSNREWIPLPPGSSLSLLPNRAALGLDKNGWLQQASTSGLPLYAVAALLPMGYARTYLPAAASLSEVNYLPLFGYTAVSSYRNRLYAAALRVEADNTAWDPDHYNTADLQNKVNLLLKQYPHNKILNQLAHCALVYNCFTAQNIFYRRWEGGIPVSPVCNARCWGCISKQISGICPSPQDRINFVPSVEEITEVAVPHLVAAEGAIISFGQGCEGEPLLMGKLLIEAVTAMRAQTDAGLINLNTNGSRPDVVRDLARAGLNNIRISLISPQVEIFNSYVRPRGYSLNQVKTSLKIAAEEGVKVSLNYLIFPGLSDREEEVEALLDFIDECPLDLIQLRNLNIDPDLYLKIVPPRQGRLLGIPGLIARLQANFPHLMVGSFTHN